MNLKHGFKKGVRLVRREIRGYYDEGVLRALFFFIVIVGISFLLILSPKTDNFVIAQIDKGRTAAVAAYGMSSYVVKKAYNKTLYFLNIEEKNITPQLPAPEVGKKKKGSNNAVVADVQLPKTPDIGYKYFVAVSQNRIGFGSGGVDIVGKHYADGTVIEVQGEPVDGPQGQTIKLILPGTGEIVNVYTRFFNGSYGSAGMISKIKWDYANNRPTGLDSSGDIGKKWYHFVILFVHRYFVLSAVAVVFLVSTALILQVNRKKLIAALFVFFLLGGWLQGNAYKTYLNKVDGVAKEMMQNKMAIRGGGFAINRRAWLDIKPPGDYTFLNFIYIPVFIGTHGAFIFWLYNAIPGVFILFYGFFVPHPAEKYIKAVKKGKISAKEALQRVDEAMYDFEKHGMPAKWKSDTLRRRIEALTKRVKAEDVFMNELIDRIKKRSRFN